MHRENARQQARNKLVGLRSTLLFTLLLDWIIIMSLSDVYTLYIDSTDVSLFPAPPFRHQGGALVSGLGTCVLASWPGKDLDLQKRKRDSIDVQETMRAHKSVALNL